MIAPEIHLVNSQFIVYFSARKLYSTIAIGVAKSSEHFNPWAPYIDLGKPILEGGEKPTTLLGSTNSYSMSPGVSDLHWFQDPQ